MSKSGDAPLNDRGNDDSRIVSQPDGSPYQTDHVPVPSGHAPRLEMRQTDDDRLRVEEATSRDEAWIEYEPMGAV